MIFFIKFSRLYNQENVPDLVEKNYFLTKSDFYKTYRFFPKFFDNLEHEIYVQIKSLNNNGYFKICSGFFLEEKDENIYYDYTYNDFINCQQKFSANITNYKEFIIDDSFYTSNISNNNGYYYVTIYIDRLTGLDFSGSYMVFVTNIEVKINLDELTGARYFYFDNSYKTKNFTFIVSFKKKSNENLHIQIAISNDQNLFDLNIKDENNENIDTKNGINSYNNFFSSSNEKSSYYINLNFFKADIINQPFAIYFEYSNLSNNIMQISNDIFEISFLTKCDYYFAQNLLSNIDNLYYVIKDLNNEKETILLSYSIINNSKFSLKKFSEKNFNACNYKIFSKFFIIFNCENAGISRLNNENILIIKLSGTGLSSLNLHKIQFKILPRIIIPEEIDFYHYSFNSKFDVEKIGYFYITRGSNEIKRKLIYCSKDKTMSIFKGDYNIIGDYSENLISNDLRLYKISDENEYTIITFSEKDNYFIQLADIPMDIYNNLLIYKVIDKTHLNQEIEINRHFKNYYIFCTNNYTNDNFDIIFDVHTIYGNISVEYNDIDIINEKDFKLNDIILFNNYSHSTINVKHPILIKKTTEIIKITNNYYNISNINKVKFYLCKYINILKNKINNSLVPIYLKPLESKKFSLYNIIGNTNYFFKLSNSYIDCINNTNEKILGIIFNKSDINYDISNINKFIKNNSYIHYNDLIEFKNMINYPILIWSYLGIKENQNEKKNLMIIELSKSYYYKINLITDHKISFDWYNIKEKIKSGLIPQKVNILIINEGETKTTGYYYENINSVKDKDNDYLLYYSDLNSISYELEQNKSHIFLCEDINLTAYDFLYSKDVQINFWIFPKSGITKSTCYIDYLYNSLINLNELQYIYSDDSIYSLNLMLNISNLKEKSRSNPKIKSYLTFQIVSNNLLNDTKAFLKDNHNAFNCSSQYNSFTIKEITCFNIFGYIYLDNLNINSSKDNIFINLIKPSQSYFKYHLFTNFEKNYSIVSSDYNIKIEKKKNSNEQLEISFDCFLKEIKTNYSILIINTNEMKDDISNEYDFFDFIYTQYYTNFKYISFINNNKNKKIRKELFFEKSGNYSIFVMAQSLDSLSLYKYLGKKTIAYNFDIIDKEIITPKKNKKLLRNNLVITLSFVLLIILTLIICIIYLNKKKRKSNPSHSDNISIITSLNSSQNEMNKSYELSIISNHYVNNIPFAEDKPNQEKNNSNFRKREENEYFSGQPPAPVLGSTFFSEEDKIQYELKKINEISNNNNSEDKKYVNTIKG